MLDAAAAGTTNHLVGNFFARLERAAVSRANAVFAAHLHVAPAVHSSSGSTTGTTPADPWGVSSLSAATLAKVGLRLRGRSCSWGSFLVARALRHETNLLEILVDNRSGTYRQTLRGATSGQA